MFSNPSVECGVAGFVILYAAAAKYSGRSLRNSQYVALLAAMLILVLSLDGPLDALEDARLFTAHMIQHLMLALVVPPLILLGTPDWIIQSLLRIPGLKAGLRFFTHPLVAYMVYSLTLVGLHSPWLYDLACRDDRFHILVHLVLIGTAILLWWPLLSPVPELPRLSYPAQLLYLFVWSIPMAAMAAPITMARSVIYPWYAGGRHPLGLSPNSDQVLGGLVMWVGAGFYTIGIATTIYFRWAQHEDVDEPEINRLALTCPAPAIDKFDHLHG